MSLVVSNQSLVSPLPEVAQERDRCFEAITREFCPSGFVETLLARQAARDAARILRDERLLDALESQSMAALAPVVAADPGSAEAFLENFPKSTFRSLWNFCSEGSAKLPLFLCERAAPA